MSTFTGYEPNINVGVISDGSPDGSGAAMRGDPGSAVAQATPIGDASPDTIVVA